MRLVYAGGRHNSLTVTKELSIALIGQGWRK
mgnify:FL=1|jgi:hypothetical protein